MCLLCGVGVCRSTLCVAVWTNVFTMWCCGVPVDPVRRRADKCVYCVVLGYACQPCVSPCGQMCLLCGVGMCLSALCHCVDKCVYCVVMVVEVCVPVGSVVWQRFVGDQCVARHHADVR